MPIYPVFGIDMQVAFNFSRGAIVELFRNIRDSPDIYEVINDDSTRMSFPNVVERIENLLDNIFPADTGLTVSYQGTEFNLESLFDLVGWIFSVTGEVPADATAANYYYPLVILYCKWCWTLCVHRWRVPQMVQITWFTQGTTKRVCLGSNLDRPGQPRKNAARRRRFDMLLTDRLAEEDERNWSYLHFGGQLIGHCAETFPALFIKSLGDVVTLENARGIAVKPIRALINGLPNKLHVPNTFAMRRDLLANPCPNCQRVLSRLEKDINLANFRVANL